MLEASAQNDENVKTRVYLGWLTCETAKIKVAIFGGGVEKWLGVAAKVRILFVKIDTFLTPQDQNTSPEKPAF